MRSTAGYTSSITLHLNRKDVTRKPVVEVSYLDDLVFVCADVLAYYYNVT